MADTVTGYEVYVMIRVPSFPSASKFYSPPSNIESREGAKDWAMYELARDLGCRLADVLEAEGCIEMKVSARITRN